MNEDAHYKLLKIIESEPKITQRELAKELGVSVGKANYCLKALIDKGWIKANNFKNSKNKLAYFYILTPSGIEQKAIITTDFLKRKISEYKALKDEIEMLKTEVKNTELNYPD
jgi:EPS-associated MarR family transcriptional regulator